MTDPLKAVLAPLADRGLRRRYRSGALIFAEGDRGSEVLLVTVGTVRLVVGPDRDMAEVFAGELLGEFAALDGRPRSASAHAMTDVELVALPAPVVIDAIDRSGELDLAAARASVASRRRRTELRSVAAGGLPIGELARSLVVRTEVDDEVGTVELDAGTLSGELGVSREHLARALDELHHRGILALDRGRVVVLDAVALRAVSEEE